MLSRLPGSRPGRLHRRRHFLRDIRIPDHRHHRARAGSAAFQPARLLRPADQTDFPGLDSRAFGDAGAGLAVDASRRLCAVERRRLRQCGVLLEYRAAAAVRLFRHRIGQEAAAASLVAGNRGTILSVLAADPDAGRPNAPELSGRGLGHRRCVLCPQRGADRPRPGGDLLSAVHPGMGIAGGRRLGLRLEPDRSNRCRQQLARGDRPIAGCGGGRRSHFQERISRMVGGSAGCRRRPAVVGARGMGLPARARQRQLCPDRADQLSALSLALAAAGIFRNHQIRPPDPAGSRSDRRAELCAGVADLSLHRNPVSIWPTEPAPDRQPGCGHGADRGGRRRDRGGPRVRFPAAAGNSRDDGCADGFVKMAGS